MIENELDKEFLLKLADLCEEYGATFDYTTEDDGIHISVDGGREVFVGHLLDAPKELRDACYAYVRTDCGDTTEVVENFEASALSGGLPWRCFHCDETFTDAKEAALHFGTTQVQQPACQLNLKWLRYVERQLERYRDEDTDLHRQIHAMESRHKTEMRREEENGYARGLAAGMTMVREACAKECDEEAEAIRREGQGCTNARYDWMADGAERCAEALRSNADVNVSRQDCCDEDGAPVKCRQL